MAATDQRQSRARAREERRGAAAKRTSEQSQAKEEQQSMQDDSSTNNGEEEGHRSRSTAKLVLAGAAAGALLGTVKSLADKRRGGSHDETEQDTNGSKSPPKKSQASKTETQPAKQRGESGGEGASAGQTSLRGMAVSVLEAAVEGLKNPQDLQAKAGTEGDGGAERSLEDDEEDEDSDSTPHGERSEADDSSPRGSAEQTGEDDDDEDEPSASAGAEEREGDERAEEDEDEEQEPEDDETDDEQSHPSADTADRNGQSDGTNVEIVRRAVSQLAELIGRRPESVSSFERRDDGLHLALEVVELERIPHSTDVIASYDVAVDDDGRVLEYARTRRYYRNRAEEEF